jgi:hypothetical protein
MFGMRFDHKQFGSRRTGILIFITLLIATWIGCSWRDNDERPVVLRWIERPNAHGPSHDAKPEDLTEFTEITKYDESNVKFDSIKKQLREGDIVAFRMTRAAARAGLLRGQVKLAGYDLLTYGHLGILVKDRMDPEKLVIFSSESFVGPNTREGIDSLEHLHWDLYRLNQWDRVDKQRLYEFVKVVEKKAGHWYGYDFSGMFGLWNSNLTPRDAASVGHDYVCSTVVLAALYYSGVELDAVRNNGYLDICTPLQVVSSKGRITTPPAVRLTAKDQRTSGTIRLDGVTTE